MMKLIIFTDGASRGNPGQASYGFTISDGGGKLLHEEGEYIGVTTNNVAEYTAVLKSLIWIKDKFSILNPQSSIHLYADSRLVIEQLSGRFKVKSAHLKPIIEKIKILEFELGGLSYKHVPRLKNVQADRLANLALDSLN